jgi:hypothetical protein
MADAPPEGFKNYLMIMTPEGRLIAPASCWVYEVNVFTQRDVERAVRDGDRLNNVARRYGGEDLAPRLVAPALADEITALNAKIERVRELHARVNTKYGKACDHCRGSDEEPMAWPCPTIAALAQPDDTGQDDQDLLTAQIAQAARLVDLTVEHGPYEAARIVFGEGT